MPGEDTALVRAPAASLVPEPTIQEWDMLYKKASTLITAGFMPPHIKNAQQAMVVFLYGRELGWPPLASINFITVINQRVRPNAAGFAALARQRIPGFQLEVLERNDKKAVVRSRRKEKDTWVTTEFTIEDAKRAKLASKDTYLMWTPDMLFSRALTRNLAVTAPDVLIGGGLTGVEEIDELPEEVKDATREPGSATGAAAAAGTALAAGAEKGVEAVATEAEERERFEKLALGLGFDVRKRDAMRRLLTNLGVPSDGAKGMLPGTWRFAYDQLAERYKDKLHPAEDTKPEASESSAVVVEEPEQKEGPESDEAQAGEPPASEPEPEADPVQVLCDLLRELRKIANNPNRRCIVAWPEGSAVWHVTDRPILRAAGLPVERAAKIASLERHIVEAMIVAARAEIAALGGGRR